MSERFRRVLPVGVLAIAGIATSVVIHVVAGRLATDVGYTSFCNVNANVNCDVVLGSHYATFAGVSVSTWSLLYHAFVLCLGIAIATAARAKLREQLAALLFAAATWGLLYSVYMAVIALFVLRAVCLLCSGLYLVSVGIFVAAWRVRAAIRPGGRRRATARAGQDRLVVLGSIGAAVALIAIGSWEALGRGAQLTDPAEIARQRPDFYRWYLAQPMSKGVLDSQRNSRGSADAAVTIVEFSDFECQHCATLHRSVDDVLHRMGHNVRVAFRHFPLDSSCNPKVTAQIHPSACLAAIAAECAAAQGQFWQYHDLLFDNQRALGPAFLIRYAERLGMDVARFNECLGSSAMRARVLEDAAEGARLGIESTPTLFINGRMIKGALEAELLANAVVLARGTR